jgi:hypothetical protein
MIHKWSTVIALLLEFSTFLLLSRHSKHEFLFTKGKVSTLLLLKTEIKDC